MISFCHRTRIFNGEKEDENVSYGMEALLTFELLTFKFILVCLKYENIKIKLIKTITIHGLALKSLDR